MANVSFSQFPSAANVSESDTIVGLKSGNNSRFSFAVVLAWIRQQLSGIFVPQTRTINSKALSSDITLDASDVGAVDADDVGVADGVASLDSTGKVPISQLPPISSDAEDITYDNTRSGLPASNVQDAIDKGIEYAVLEFGSIEGVIPSAASASNQLADKAFVTDSITQGTAIFRGSFATKAALLAVAWQTTNPDAPYFVSNNDYAVVLDDETQNDECWRYIYVTGTGWTPQYKINESPMTQAQLAALNSGATAAIINSVSDKLNKTGDGKDVTVTFSAASTRANISTGEKLSVMLGKIAKWFADLGTAAFRAATGSITSGSMDLVESGAVYTGLAGKQSTITANGILKGDGLGGVSAATPGTDYATPTQMGIVTLGTSWSGAGPYYQTVTVTGATITANSKVNLQFTPNQIASLIADGVSAILTENNNGTLTVYAIGASPTSAMTVQCTVEETI